MMQSPTATRINPATTLNRLDQLNQSLGCYTEPSISKEWNSLQKNTARIQYPQGFYTAHELATNVDTVQCPKHSAAQVRYQQRLDPIHVNAVALMPAQADASHSPLRLGQSPQTSQDAEKLLLHATNDPQQAGIFQFVSRTAHNTPDQSREKSMLDLLQARFNQAHKSSVPFMIDDQLVIGRIEYQASVTPDIKSAILHGVRVDTGAQVRVPITQVGLKFDGVLAQPDIEQASHLYDAHMALTNPFQGATSPASPVVLSYGGVGRSAVLLVHQAMKERIHQQPILTESTLKTELENMVMKGRQDRGPLFIPNEQQLHALFESLRNQMVGVLEKRFPNTLIMA